MNTIINMQIVIPYNTPSKNNTMITKEALKNSLSDLSSVSGPIKMQEKIVGHLFGNPSITNWDDKVGMCTIDIRGLFYSCAVSLKALEKENGIVKTFEIDSVNLDFNE